MSHKAGAGITLDPGSCPFLILDRFAGGRFPRLAPEGCANIR